MADEEDGRGPTAGDEARGPAARAPEAGGDYQWLEQGAITAYQLLPSGSNYTFLASVRHEGVDRLAIYKPRAGEEPLWDFPSGTLHRRECAAFLVSRALGWPNIPPTVIRGGPLGVGALQAYVEADPEANYFTFGKRCAPESRAIALFDLLSNNADRKAGHCLLGTDRIWAIDHGLTFHVTPKLRTVIWDFAGEDIPAGLVNGVSRLCELLSAREQLFIRLRRLLSVEEMHALLRRVELLLHHPVFPKPGPGRSIPWPPI